MVCVGLDVGREKHDYVLLGEDRQQLLDGTFPNESWAFRAWCEHVEAKCGTREIKLAYETANGLATPLDQFLLERGWELVTIPPSAVKSYRQNVLRQHDKTDKNDAWTLALLARERLGPTNSHSQPRRALRTLTRWRQELVRDKTRTINRLRQVVAAYWPEATKGTLIDNYDALYVVALFEHYPDPTKFGRLAPTAVLKRFRKSGSRIPSKRVLMLQNLARQNSVSPLEKNQLVKTAQVLARRLRHLLEDLQGVDNLLEEMAKSDPMIQVISELSGIGLTLAATYLGEVQDIGNFPTEAALASYSGLALRRIQTGKSKDYRVPQRAANKRLKRCMTQIALCRQLHDQESHKYYQRKLGEGKSHLQALRSLARHISRRFYKTLTALQA